MTTTDQRPPGATFDVGREPADSAPPAPVADLTTIIVNWNTVDLLDDCLRSVEANVPQGITNRTIVVDNASHDDSVAKLRRDWPHVEVIANEENVGFCRANNQALRIATSPVVLLINTDARLTQGALATMLDRLAADPRAAIVGPRLEYGDGSFQRWTAGASFSLRSLGSYFLGFDRFADRVPALAGIYLAHDTRTAFRPGWVSSAVMVIRREALDQVGLLDERIFVYMDDVDLCQRAVDAGWHVWYAADATAVHFMGASTKRTTGKASPEALRALNRWFVRRRGRGAGRVLRMIEAAGFGARVAAHGTRSVVRRDPAGRRQAAAHLTHLKLSLERIDV
jgi:N-acetylglucosaminyl-diphospho-decaprenol L-rhamnosyltransferase